MDSESVFSDANKEQKTFASIICLDLTNYDYEIYSQNGLMINKIDFSHLVEKYGVPMKTSNNGQNFIFKKTIEQIEDMREQGKSIYELT